MTFWFNKIGPYHNPQETYSYYYLPFCQPTTPKPLKEGSDSLGVILEGDELTDSGLSVKFRENQRMSRICELHVGAAEKEAFVEAVQAHYWYQMYIDELPIWGMVGEYMMAEASKPQLNQPSIREQGFIYTHKDFSISYNGNQIIEVNLTSDNPKPLKVDTTLPLTFSVTWHPTDKEFSTRFDRYLDFDFFEHQIHWFSIFNSFMMVVFLCGLVALILMRTLRNDYARYTSEDEEMELDKVVDESGWKQVHGDVFRAPRYLVLYSALLGTGYQLFTLALCVISVTLVATMYDERGSMMTSLLICYCLTSLISGYSSSSFYKRYGGTEWKAVMMLTATLYPGLAFTIAFFLNFIALSYDSSASYSLGTYTLLVALWLFASCPLVLLGTLIGRSTTVPGDFPCRVNTLRRPIPDSRWYTRATAMSLFAGVLPFGSIFIEMYFIFTSFWNYKSDHSSHSQGRSSLAHLCTPQSLTSFSVSFLLPRCQVLLRVRLHVSGVPHPAGGDRVRDHRHHVRAAERGGLQVALERVRLRCQHRPLRAPLRRLLLLHQDQDERHHADGLLLRIHGAL